MLLWDDSLLLWVHEQELEWPLTRHRLYQNKWAWKTLWIPKYSLAVWLWEKWRIWEGKGWIRSHRGLYPCFLFSLVFDVSTNRSATLLLANVFSEAFFLICFIFIFFCLSSDIRDVPSLEHLGPPKTIWFPGVSSSIPINVICFLFFWSQFS